MWNPPINNWACWVYLQREDSVNRLPYVKSPSREAAYKFMNAFLGMQRTINGAGACRAPCPNLNSCMPKQMITQRWCAEWERPCSATAWIVLLGDEYQHGYNGDTWNIFTLTQVLVLAHCNILGTSQCQRHSACHTLGRIWACAGAHWGLGGASLPRVAAAAAAAGDVRWSPWPAPAELRPPRSAVWLWPAPASPGSSPLPPEPGSLVPWDVTNRGRGGGQREHDGVKREGGMGWANQRRGWGVGGVLRTCLTLATCDLYCISLAFFNGMCDSLTCHNVLFHALIQQCNRNLV